MIIIKNQNFKIYIIGVQCQGGFTMERQLTRSALPYDYTCFADEVLHLKKSLFKGRL